MWVLLPNAMPSKIYPIYPIKIPIKVFPIKSLFRCNRFGPPPPPSPPHQWRVSTAGRRATAEGPQGMLLLTNINNNNKDMKNLALLGFAIAMQQTKNQILDHRKL